MLKKAISYLLLILLIVPFTAGCYNTAETTSEPDYSSAVTERPDKDADVKNHYLLNKQFPCVPLSDLSPILQIDIKTGEILTLCPDPACTHDKYTPTCVYNSITLVEAVCEGGGYVLFTATGKSNEALYIYDRINNTVKMLRTVQHASSYIVYGDGKFFFTETMNEEEITDENTVKLIMLDPLTGKETVIARVTKNETVYDYYDGCVITRVYLSQYFNRISVNEPYTKTKILTPDGGEEFSVGGYLYRPGNIAAKLLKPSAVYLYDRSEYVDLPVDSQITAVQRVGDTVVFQTVDPEPVKVKTDTDENGDDVFALIYMFDPVVYFVNADGSYDAYEVETDYMFSVSAVIGHKIFAVSDTLIKDGEPLIDQAEKSLLIDLETGETVIYDFESYDFNNKDVPTERISLTVNKIH